MTGLGYTGVSSVLLGQQGLPWCSLPQSSFKLVDIWTYSEVSPHWPGQDPLDDPHLVSAKQHYVLADEAIPRQKHSKKVCPPSLMPFGTSIKEIWRQLSPFAQVHTTKHHILAGPMQEAEDGDWRTKPACPIEQGKAKTLPHEGEGGLQV